MNRTSDGPVRVVVVNQHGDNRGDEAAMRAMVRGLGSRLPPAEFTVIHQFADAASEVALDHPVRYLSMRLSPGEHVRLAAFAALRALGVRSPRVAGVRGREIVEAIAGADLVVSAPGGPYFGDIYADHEAVHWLYVWLAHKEGGPLALYAPSCGPFAKRWLNPLRRRGFRWFDSVSLREDRSAAMLAGLTDVSVTVTTDAALQDVVAPADRGPYAGEDERLLVVAVRDPGDEQRARHDRSIAAAIDRVCRDRPTSVVLLPQLHGRGHRDAPYLGGLAERVSTAKRVQVAPETLDSATQRALVAAADMVIAGRDHPAVIAISAATPLLVVAYEHKAMGLAEAAGIAEWATWVADVEPDALADLAEALIGRAAAVRAVLEPASARLRELSARSSDLAASLVT
jgi:polysaccharide pyruvyl transferase WcaK-like protein